MALKIDKSCVGCDMCLPACPNHAITQTRGIYKITPEHCTECVGFYEQPQCISVCPIDCIATDPQHIESQATLLIKHLSLYPESLSSTLKP